MFYKRSEKAAWCVWVGLIENSRNRDVKFLKRNVKKRKQYRKKYYTKIFILIFLASNIFLELSQNQYSTNIFVTRTRTKDNRRYFANTSCKTFFDPFFFFLVSERIRKKFISTNFSSTNWLKVLYSVVELIVFIFISCPSPFLSSLFFNRRSQKCNNEANRK